MAVKRHEVDQEAGYPGTARSEELERNQVQRQHDENSCDHRGDLRSPLPVARPVATDQSMNHHDRRGIDRVINGMNQPFRE